MCKTPTISAQRICGEPPSCVFRRKPILSVDQQRTRWRARVGRYGGSGSGLPTSPRRARQRRTQKTQSADHLRCADQPRPDCPMLFVSWETPQMRRRENAQALWIPSACLWIPSACPQLSHPRFFDLLRSLPCSPPRLESWLRCLVNLAAAVLVRRTPGCSPFVNSTPASSSARCRASIVLSFNSSPRSNLATVSIETFAAAASSRMPRPRAARAIRHWTGKIIIA